MNLFIDTEFSELTRDAQLISFAAVAEDGQAFYCELAPLPTATSAFVREVVLPLLEGGPAVCRREDFAGRLAAWLGRFDNPMLLCDSDWDIYVLRHAVSGERHRRPGPLTLSAPVGRCEAMLLMLRPLSGDDLALYERTVAACLVRDPRPHHALADARAIREGYLAVRAASAAE